MRPFSLLIKPAGADCNLRCEYCFYLDRCGGCPESPRRMDDTTLDAMIRSFMATEQPHHVFGWQGGEPTLMGLPFFERVTELQMKHGRRGATVSNGLQTNATLLDDAMARHFAEFRFLLGVSLDGPPELHDRFRRTAAGAPSHAEVLRGIATLRRNRVEFNILVLVSAANVRQGREVYRYLRDEGFLHHQYIPCVEFAADGRLRPFSVSGPEWGDFLCAVYDEWRAADTRRVSVRLFDSILAYVVDGARNACTLGRDCRQYLVVEHNGDVYPCDFFVEPSRRLGNLRADSWETLRASERYAEFGRRKAGWSGQCAACEYLDLCAGDCQKHRPSGGAAASVLCPGWRQFYGHALAGLKELAGEIRAQRAAALPRGKVGPNDSCACGSGRKHKKCCGRG